MGRSNQSRETRAPPDTRVFGSRFIDKLKRSDQGTKRKSRVVVQNYADDGAGQITMKAPTVQLFSRLLLLSLAASRSDMQTFSQDITQEYVQNSSKFERDVYISPPPELRLPSDIVLKIVRLLYGVPESGFHWYLPFLDHHDGNFKMV